MERVPHIRQGERIRARTYLQPLERSIKELQQGAPRPRPVESTRQVDGELEPAEVWAEIDRTVSVVRVTNPGDSAQFVDVERIDSITFQRSTDGQSITMEFANG